MARYPITGPASVMECPVHGFTVALNAAGRIASPCPGCIQEARRARRRWAQRRRRALAAA